MVIILNAAGIQVKKMVTKTPIKYQSLVPQATKLYQLTGRFTSKNVTKKFNVLDEYRSG